MLDILLAIGIPLIAGIVLMLWKSIAAQKKLSLESTREVALDMIFLALGGAGAIFNDFKVSSLLRGKTIGILMLLVFVDLMMASIILYRQRFRSKGTMTRLQAAADLALGVVCLVLVAGVIYAGSVNAEVRT